MGQLNIAMVDLLYCIGLIQYVDLIVYYSDFGLTVKACCAVVHPFFLRLYFRRKIIVIFYLHMLMINDLT